MYLFFRNHLANDCQNVILVALGFEIKTLRTKSVVYHARPSKHPRI